MARRLLSGRPGTRPTVVLLAAALALSAGAAASHTPGALDGAWTVVSAERDGKPADELKGHRLTFSGHAFVIEREGQTLYKGTVTVGARRKPARIDFVHTEGTLKGTRWLGVYTLERDTLRIADNAPDPTKPRPAALAAGPGSGHVLLIFERAR